MTLSQKMLSKCLALEEFVGVYVDVKRPGQLKGCPISICPTPTIVLHVTKSLIPRASYPIWLRLLQEGVTTPIPSLWFARSLIYK